MVALQGKMAAVHELHDGIRQVALEGLGTGGDE